MSDALFSNYFEDLLKVIVTPPALGTPIGFDLIPLEFRQDLCRHKARITGISCGIVCVILTLAV